MGELISGKEAKLAWAEGVDVQVATGPYKFRTLVSSDDLGIFDCGNYFRLKPRTITINGIEVPATFEPKFKDVFYYLDGAHAEGFSWRKMHDDTPLWFFENPVWRTEEEIKQVVAALRSVFGKK